MSKQYIFFCSHDPNKYSVSNRDNAVFSNWYESKFIDNTNTEYEHVEQYMMVQKALVMDDKLMAIQILNESDPKRCKELGRMVKNFDPHLWDEDCSKKVVIQGNLYKFSQNPVLKEILLRTGDKILVEAAWYDKIWGVGLKASDPNILDPKKWKGTNWLGECLMNVRERLS